MTIQSVLLPVFVLVLLTFVLLFWMGRERFGALRRGEVKAGDVGLGQNAWPARPAQLSRSFQNQFETPLLFYVLVVLAIITKKDDFLFVVMEWLYVIARLAHAAIHTTNNRVTLRFPAFLAGVLILIAMWVVFAVRIFIH
ncbi:MAG: hypothetical protein JWM36_135 [Hyphomicrobiales bacterium]|nr:hypothetical protein [Hyphomicrobiales bacterium]